MEYVKRFLILLLMGLGVLFLIGGATILMKPVYHDNTFFVKELESGKVKTGDKIEFKVRDIVKDTILADEVIHTEQTNVVYLFENPQFVEYDKTYTYPILSTKKVMGVWIVTVDNDGEDK